MTVNREKMAPYREGLKALRYDPSKYGTYLEQLGIPIRWSADADSHSVMIHCQALLVSNHRRLITDRAALLHPLLASMRPLRLALRLLSIVLPAAAFAAADAGTPVEPVIYTGSLKTDKNFTDGRLPHAIGVHHYQVFRANRTHPPEGGITAGPQPPILSRTYWNGRYTSGVCGALWQEHGPPTRTLRSLLPPMGANSFAAPTVILPEYQLPAIDSRDGIKIAAGTGAVMHQRMGFYVAPNGRLLTLGFYGYAATPRHSPNAGNGLGRVIRKVKADGSSAPSISSATTATPVPTRAPSFPFYRRAMTPASSPPARPCYRTSS